jgi:hypothetical protein
MISDSLLAQFWFTVLIEESEYRKKKKKKKPTSRKNDRLPDVAVFPHNKIMKWCNHEIAKNCRARHTQHNRQIHVRQGATYLKLTCSLPGCSHSCFRTCSQASHSAPTSWTELVAHTNTEKRNKKDKPTGVGNLRESRANRTWEGSVAKNDALENPRRAIELGSFYRSREATKTRRRPRSPPPRILRHVTLSCPLTSMPMHVVVVQSAIAFVTRHVTYPVESASACVTTTRSLFGYYNVFTRNHLSLHAGPIANIW